MKTRSLAAMLGVLGLGAAAALASAPAVAQDTTEAVTGASAGTGGDAPGRQQMDMDMNTRYGTRLGMAYSDLDADASGTVTFDEMAGDMDMTDEDRMAGAEWYGSYGADAQAGLNEQEFDMMRERLAGQNGTGGNGANNSNN